MEIQREDQNSTVLNAEKKSWMVYKEPRREKKNM